jgi:hypothetical protein
MSEPHSESVEAAVDNLFIDILGSEGEKPDYYQAKVDFVAARLEKKPQLLGYRVYKLHTAQALVEFYRDNLTTALQDLDKADEALGDHKAQRPYIIARQKIIDTIQAKAKLQGSKRKVAETRSAFLHALLYSISLFTIGGIFTGIAYAIAEPGETYIVTSGAFLVGGVYACIAIYRFCKWMIQAGVNG